MHRLIAGEGKCNVSLFHTNSFCGCGLNMEMIRGGARCSLHSSLYHPCSLLPLHPLCLRDRLPPWSAPLSSCKRSRKASRQSLSTIPKCSKKRIQISTLLASATSTKTIAGIQDRELELNVYRFSSVCELLIALVLELNKNCVKKAFLYPKTLCYPNNFKNT